jgi:formiminotetrahydrofolate cyclodeaminase
MQMNEALTAMSCDDFVDAVAARQPAPSGGGAAALVGALGVALGSMAAEFTRGKRRYAAYEADLTRMLDEAEGIRATLLDLVDSDAVGVIALTQAYAIPKDDPARPAALERATRGAISAPLEMMRQVCRAIATLEELGEKGSRLLLSDVGCGALLCRGALEAASLNVFVNTRDLADRELAGTTEAECDQMLAEWCPRAEALAVQVMNDVRGGE